MKIGIMGGTFDPIHIGHLVAAEAAREAASLDEVWFLPTNIPPHKEDQPKATPEERLEMVFRAIDFQPYFRAIDIELARGGVSYSVDTAAELKELYPDRSFHYIIGADMVQYLPKWHQIEKLADMVSFIGLARPGTTLALDELPEYIRDKVTVVPMPMLDISSTDIRSRKTQGQSIRFLVPEKVFQFIKRNDLYGA